MASRAMGLDAEHQTRSNALNVEIDAGNLCLSHLHAPGCLSKMDCELCIKMQLKSSVGSHQPPLCIFLIGTKCSKLLTAMG